MAVKVLTESLAHDPERLRRFEQEARSVAALNHPNVLALYDIGAQDGQPYLVSELLEGQSLRQALEGGALPARKAGDYAVQVATGLAAAHEKGIIHPISNRKTFSSPMKAGRRFSTSDWRNWLSRLAAELVAL